MQILFIVVEDHQVISVTEIKTDPFYLFQPMVKISQIEVCKVLAKVVADWQTFSAIDDFIKQPQQISIFEFPAQKQLKDGVIY